LEDEGDVCVSQANVLYQSVILDHNRAPRGAQPLLDATHRAEGFNPICGDRILITIRAGEDKFFDLGFNAQSCALCRASASVLVETLKTKTLDEAKSIIGQFEAMLSGGSWSWGGDAEAFTAMKDFPARAKCVLLPWKTVMAAFSASSVDPVSRLCDVPTVTTEPSEGAN
jgi:nitrogen fixation NifU-like protein